MEGPRRHRLGTRVPPSPDASAMQGRAGVVGRARCGRGPAAAGVVKGATKRSRALLDALGQAQGSTVAELAAITGEPLSYVSNVLKYERRKGIVEGDRCGQRRA